MITRHLTQLIVAASLAAGVTGCSSIPEKNAALDAARDDYYAAANDPQVTAQAPLELQEAEQALSQGEQLLLDGGAVEAVEQQAYLARQQVAIAREQARLKSAERVVANAQGERQQVLLAAKTRERTCLSSSSRSCKRATPNAD